MTSWEISRSKENPNLIFYRTHLVIVYDVYLIISYYPTKDASGPFKGVYFLHLLPILAFVIAPTRNVPATIRREGKLFVRTSYLTDAKPTLFGASYPRGVARSDRFEYRDEWHECVSDV